MSVFRYRSLLANVGQFGCLFTGGCGNTACGNFPNTCHVITCQAGTRFCGIPSCNFTQHCDVSGTIFEQCAVSGGCVVTRLVQDPQDPITLVTLKRDLRAAIAEIEEIEKRQGAEGVDAALKQLDAATEELDQLRRDLKAKRGKKG